MRVLGIDPGYAIIGYGIVELRGNQLISIHYGHIATSAKNTYHERLLAINQELMVLLETWQPDALSIEKIFFAKNVKTAIDVAQVRGTLLLECLKKKMTVEEYRTMHAKAGQRIAKIPAESRAKAKAMLIGGIARVKKSNPELAKVMAQWSSSGKLSLEQRQRIRNWAQCVEAPCVASYVEEILTHVYEGGPKPQAPWRLQ